MDLSNKAVGAAADEPTEIPNATASAVITRMRGTRFGIAP